MRNLYFSSFLSTYRIDLCNQLYERLGCEIFHYRRDTSNCFDEAALERKAVFPIHTLETGRLFGRPYVKNLAALVKQYRPEYVFVLEYSPITFRLLTLRKRFGFKLVAFCDDSPDMLKGNDISLVHRIARRFMPRFLDNLILSSREVAEWYRKVFSKGIYFPIIQDERRLLAEMAEASPMVPALEVKYGLTGKKVILFVGRLIAVKNIPVFLKACAVMGRDDILPVIIGDGEERERLEGLNREWNAGALFLGVRTGEELMAWYQRVDLFVLPSIREAFGAVVNEALVAGCPVLVSSHAGAAELVVPGWNGEVFSPDSESELAEKMKVWLDRTEDGPEARPSLMPVRFEPLFEHLLEEL